jgi:peptide/nickel transport system permease protein
MLLIVLSLNYLGDAVRDAVELRTDAGPRGLLQLWPTGRSSATSARRALATRLRDRTDEIRTTNQRDLPVVQVDALHVAVADPRSPACGRTIVDGVDLHLAEGECLGIVGESGSGKSTLALALLGLLRQPLLVDGGAVHLLGEETRRWTWDDWRLVRGNLVSLVTQDPSSALNPVLTILAQLLEAVRGPEAGDHAARLARIDAVLDRVHLSKDILDLYPHQLSGGMRQRVVIAMAVVNRPLVLIADEPTTALDVTTQARVLELLRELRSTLGLAMIFISHDLRLVAQVADRVVVMRDGRVVETGATSDIFARPDDPYTRQLVEAMPRARFAVEVPA